MMFQAPTWFRSSGPPGSKADLLQVLCADRFAPQGDLTHSAIKDTRADVDILGGFKLD